MNSFIDNTTMEEAVKEIERLIESGIASYVVPINVDVVIKIDKDEKLKEIVDNVNLVLANGRPLVWISIVCAVGAVRWIMYLICSIG